MVLTNQTIGPTQDEPPGKQPTGRWPRRPGRAPATLVEVADLAGRDVRHHEADEEREQQREPTAEARAGVALHLLVGLEVPEQRVDPERDDREGDAGAGAADLPERGAVDGIPYAASGWAPYGTGAVAWVWACCGSSC